MTVITDEQKINELLTRGVEEIFVKDHLKAALLSGQELRIKFGIDPTGPKIHIGRAVALRKLRAFQDLGHKIVLIVGDFTAQVGDASDKDGKRPMLTREQIDQNLSDYKAQLGKIINLDKAELRYNSEWLGKLNFNDIATLAEHFSVQQMLRRRNFSDRYERGDEISLREFMYPLMQGYDSVAVQSDVELGGFDQLFNLQAGRVLQKAHNMDEQDIMTVQMIEGTDGRKMSTSWGNIITIVDEPNDMFGKIMSVRDDLISKYMILCTNMSEDEINALDATKAMENKKRLGRELVTLYHSKELAEMAQENWEKTFSDGGIPDDIKSITVGVDTLLIDVLTENNLVESKSDFRRLIDEGAIKVMHEQSEEKITDYKYAITIPVTLKVGKKKFVKITV